MSDSKVDMDKIAKHVEWKCPATTIRIPTKHAYAYVEIPYFGNDAKAEYDRLYHEFNGTGVSEMDFCDRLIATIDSNLEEWGTADNYAELSDCQKFVYQALKRLSKRKTFDEGVGGLGGAR